MSTKKRKINTLEDFADNCEKIKNGATDIEIPCCAHCVNYKKLDWLQGRGSKYRCIHPRIMTDGSHAWIVMQPNDFCSRFEENKNG